MPLPWLIHSAKQGDYSSQYYLWITCLLSEEDLNKGVKAITYQDFLNKKSKSGRWAEYWGNKVSSHQDSEKDVNCHIVSLFRAYEKEYQYNNGLDIKVIDVLDSYKKLSSRYIYSDKTAEDVKDRILTKISIG